MASMGTHRWWLGISAALALLAVPGRGLVAQTPSGLDVSGAAVTAPADEYNPGAEPSLAHSKGLKVKPRKVRFGLVTQFTVLAVAISNPGSEPVEVSVSPPSAPFLLRDSLDSAVFTLAAGQSRSLNIEFGPQSKGKFKSSMMVIANGKSIRVNLTGKAEGPTRVPVAAGDVLFAGGLGPDNASTELYRAATNTFAPPGSMPVMNTGRPAGPFFLPYSITATALSNGKVLIAGGIGSGTGDGLLASTELYDPTTNTFAPAANTATMNEGRSEAVAVQLNNGKVLIAGSIQSGGALASTELYDPVSNSFAALAQTATMNESRDNAVAATLSSGKVLIAGGVQFPPFLTDLYDPASNSFAPPAQTAAMSERFGAVAVALNNGKVLIAGGDTLFAVNVLATTDLYDEATNTFAPPSATATMNTPRVAFAGVLLTAGPNAGKALMIGGQGFFGGRSTMALSSTDLYDPITNSFAPSNETPTMNIARIGVTATVLNNGKVLVAGGAQQVELYDPMTNTFTLGPMMNSVPPSNEGYGGYITATLIK